MVAGDWIKLPLIQYSISICSDPEFGYYLTHSIMYSVDRIRFRASKPLPCMEALTTTVPVRWTPPPVPTYLPLLRASQHPPPPPVPHHPPPPVLPFDGDLQVKVQPWTWAQRSAPSTPTQLQSCEPEFEVLIQSNHLSPLQIRIFKYSYHHSPLQTRILRLKS